MDPASSYTYCGKIIYGLANQWAIPNPQQSCGHLPRITEASVLSFCQSLSPRISSEGGGHGRAAGPSSTVKIKLTRSNRIAPYTQRLLLSLGSLLSRQELLLLCRLTCKAKASGGPNCGMSAECHLACSNPLTQKSPDAGLCNPLVLLLPLSKPKRPPKN